MSENQEVVLSNEPARGPCGIVGEGSASSRLKRAHAKSKSRASLKQFARDLAKSGDGDAQAWFLHKKPSFFNEAKAARLVRHGARISAEKAATKLARKKDKSKQASK